MDAAGEERLVPSPETVIRGILRENLAPLIGLAAEQGNNHNMFLEAISPTIAVTSKLTRSLTSRLGKRFASIARAMAVERYGTVKVPSVLYSGTLESPPHRSIELSDDTAIYSQLDQRATRAAAIDLLRRAHATNTELNRPGNPGDSRALI